MVNRWPRGPTIHAAWHAWLAPAAVTVIHRDGGSPSPCPTSPAHPRRSGAAHPRGLGARGPLPGRRLPTRPQRPALQPLPSHGRSAAFGGSARGPSAATGARVGERNRPSTVFSRPLEMIWKSSGRKAVNICVLLNPLDVFIILYWLVYHYTKLIYYDY